MLQGRCDKQPRPRRSAVVLCTATMLVVAGGCGQKGPLYLPDAEPASEHEEVPEIERDLSSDLSG